MIGFEVDIDRLVDGELTPERRRELLLACEERGQWRDVALAYVESQTLSGDLRAFRDAPSDSEVRVETSDKRGRNREQSWHPLSLVAAVMLSLGVGYGAAWMLQVPSVGSVTQPVAVATAKPNGPSEEEPVGGAATRDQDSASDPAYSSMQFTVSDPISNGYQQIDLPVVPASSLGPNWQRRILPSVSEELLQEMRQSGLGLRQDRAWIPVRMHNGRTVVVPIEYYFEQRLQ